MLTVFSTAKPFVGHDGIIQRNAILSWTLLHPQVEVILFGDESGTAGICSELGLVHEPYANRNVDGMKYVHYLFARVNEIARHPYLCFANCDIILPRELIEAVERVAAAFDRFLIVGRRWNIHVDQPLRFEDLAANDLNRRIRKHGKRGAPNGLDYFVFPRGEFCALPPFLVGRFYWDNWMVWDAYSRGVPVVDVSGLVNAGHQIHGRDYHPGAQLEGEAVELYGRDNAYNRRLLASLLAARGDNVAVHIIDRWIWLNIRVGVYGASHILDARRLRQRTTWSMYALLWRQRAEWLAQVGVGLTLRRTRRVRHALGIRSETLSRLSGRMRTVTDLWASPRIDRNSGPPRKRRQV